MVSGVFVENMPFVRIVVGWGQAVQAPFVVLDTGFTGDLQVTPEMAKELSLEVAGVTEARFANGQVAHVPVALALAAMEGETQYVEVLIADTLPLAGISFLSKFGYKAVVDCKHWLVALERQ